MRRPALIVLVAFILRVVVAGYLLANNHWSWGVSEPAGIARALIEGRGFSSAFHDSPGPTAWLAPVYPALLACIFRIFGVATTASAIAAILLNVVFSSLTAAVLLRFGKEQLSESAGVLAAWGFALAPPLLFIPWLPWETSLSGLVLTFGLMIMLRLRAFSTLRAWAGCGAIWAFAALLNPAILAPLPALLTLSVVQSRRWKGVAMMIAVCVLGILPWTLRNYRAFGQIIPVRSNFWPEAYFGNVGFSLHPTGTSMLYQREGEVRFASDLKQRTLNFVCSNPGAFWQLTGRRVLGFWMVPPQFRPYPLVLLLMCIGGIVQAARQKKKWADFASVLALYPLIYYITYTFSRYRYPIEPLMYALAAYFVCEMWEIGSGRLHHSE